jgi:hypothetical protein
MRGVGWGGVLDFQHGSCALLDPTLFVLLYYDFHVLQVKGSNKEGGEKWERTPQKRG